MPIYLEMSADTCRGRVRGLVEAAFEGMNLYKLSGIMFRLINSAAEWV